MGKLLDSMLGRAPRPDYLASPWHDEGSYQLKQIGFAELFGDVVAAGVPLSRATAMGIPAVAKGRNLLVATIAKQPLRALTVDGLVPNQPTWLYRTDSGVSPWHRMAWTLDDLIFYGASLWQVVRGSDGFIIDAERVDYSRWTVDPHGAILIDNQPVDANEVVYIPSGQAGLLESAARTLRGAIDVENAWVGRARNPIPAMELHVTDDTELTEDEAAEYVKAWGQQRRNPDGAVGLTPKGIDLRTHGEVSADVAVEGRNAIRTDIGSFLGIPAGLMDASLATASLTYQTEAGTRSQWFDFGLPLWTSPIEHRLSLDDVVPRGQRVRFDFTDLLGAAPSPTGSATDD